MTPCFHIMGPIGQSKHDDVSSSSPVAAPEAKSDVFDFIFFYLLLFAT